MSYSKRVAVVVSLVAAPCVDALKPSAKKVRLDQAELSDDKVRLLQQKAPDALARMSQSPGEAEFTKAKHQEATAVQQSGQNQHDEAPDPELLGAQRLASTADNQNKEGMEAFNLAEKDFNARNFVSAAEYFFQAADNFKVETRLRQNALKHALKHPQFYCSQTEQFNKARENVKKCLTEAGSAVDRKMREAMISKNLADRFLQDGKRTEKIELYRKLSADFKTIMKFHEELSELYKQVWVWDYDKAREHKNLAAEALGESKCAEAEGVEATAVEQFDLNQRVLASSSYKSAAELYEAAENAFASSGNEQKEKKARTKRNECRQCTAVPDYCQIK